MAKTETVQIDSAELFEAAMSDDPVTETEQVAAAEEVTEEHQPRDEAGRFAARTEPEQPQQTEQVQTEAAREEANVPSWRLREISEERRAAVTRAEQAERDAANFRSEMEALRRQIAQQTAPTPEPVDIFVDPNKWAEQQLSPLEQRMQSMATNLTLRASRAENVAIHGREKVNAAEKAIGEAMQSGDPELAGLKAKMLASDDPVGVAVEWHQSRSLLKETGGDLNAYRQKALDEALKDPAFLARALEAAKAQANGNGQTKPANMIQTPPSLGRVSAARAAADEDTDMSDGGLFRHAMS